MFDNQQSIRCNSNLLDDISNTFVLIYFSQFALLTKNA